MGINLGLCGYNGHDGQMPEMYTSLLYLGVNTWVRDMSSPYGDKNFCSDITNKNPPDGGAVSILFSRTRNEGLQRFHNHQLSTSKGLLLVERVSPRSYSYQDRCSFSEWLLRYIFSGGKKNANVEKTIPKKESCRFLKKHKTLRLRRYPSIWRFQSVWEHWYPLCMCSQQNSVLDIWKNTQDKWK